MLYSVGGHDGPLVRKSVEVYNPESRTWTPISDMNFCRRNAGIIAHNGLLFVIGGDDGTRLGPLDPLTETLTTGNQLTESKVT
jgi:kelch-like protein 2/3